MSEKTQITQRSKWDSGSGGEHVYIQVDSDSKLTVEMLADDDTIHSSITLQNDGRDRTEITIGEGRVTIYND